MLADPFEVDIRTDIYSLGVILYELLAGRPPYTISKKLHETIQTIREEDPGEAGSIDRCYRGDIESIAAKTLDKDKTRRYASAADVAEDIQRHLHDQPIVTRPASTSINCGDLLARKALVAGIAAVFVVLVGGIVASMWQRQVAERARAQAEAQKVLAERALDAAQVNLYFNNIDFAEREWAAFNIGHADELLDEHPSHCGTGNGTTWRVSSIWKTRRSPDIRTRFLRCSYARWETVAHGKQR